jgi:hypothetical protein
MSAAIEAHAAGLAVVVADEGDGPGGQIYRNAADSPLADINVLGDDYLAGRALIERFVHSGSTHLPRCTVWQVTVSYPSYDQAYTDLVAGRVDAVLRDAVQGKLGFLATPSGKGFAFAGDVVYDPEDHG